VTVAVVVNNVSKTFQLRHHHTVRDMLLRRRPRRDSTKVVRAVDSVSFRVDAGEGVAVMGVNGSGKSTLLQLICGILRPDEGSVRIRGQVAGLIGASAGFHPELTGRENISLNAALLGMSRAQTESKFDQIVDFAGVERFLDTPVKYYSSGMFSRLGFAVAINTDPDVFLVDEVLAVGDSQFKRKCRQALLERRETGLTLIIVAHETALLRKICTRGIVLDHGATAFDGPIAEAAALIGDDEDDDAMPAPDADFAAMFDADR
jgi:ABC-2 type transport system ATP-binding protein